MKLKEHEETFPVRPVGIKYRCEFCNEGEQILDKSEKLVISAGQKPKLRKHKCNKCGKEMMLPKAYPYIEWLSISVK